MVAQAIRFNVKWPDEVSIFELRPWLLVQIKNYGKPLRWAITAVEARPLNGEVRILTIEAVITREDFLDLEHCL